MYSYQLVERRRFAAFREGFSGSTSIRGISYFPRYRGGPDVGPMLTLGNLFSNSAPTLCSVPGNLIQSACMVLLEDSS